jgi:hypothetical protein
MNHLEAISKRILSSGVSKRIIAASVRLGIFIFLFATSSTASALEAIAKLLQKLIQDDAGASDANSKAVGKALLDGSETSDNNAKTVGKNITDQLFSTDDINGAGADDDQNISFFKVLTNPSFAVDNIVLLAAFLRSFSNTASASDSAVILSGKTAQDFAAILDAEVKLAVIGKADTMTAADTGQLLNQDYVDNPNYFLEDYVGIKRTF